MHPNLKGRGSEAESPLGALAVMDELTYHLSHVDFGAMCRHHRHQFCEPGAVAITRQQTWATLPEFLVIAWWPN
jgi:hypothetical protein